DGVKLKVQQKQDQPLWQALAQNLSWDELKQGLQQLNKTKSKDVKLYRLFRKEMGIYDVDENSFKGEPAITEPQGTPDEEFAGKTFAPAKDLSAASADIAKVRSSILPILDERHKNDIHHGLKHANDLIAMALALAEEAKVYNKVDWKVMTAAILLHDIYAYEDKGHALKTVEYIDKHLADNPLFTKSQIEKIKEAVLWHDEKTLQNISEIRKKNLETRILYDVDNMDAFGVKGIYRYMAIYFARGKDLTAIKEKVLDNLKFRFKNLCFDESKEMAQEDFEYAKAFFALLKQENTPEDSLSGATAAAYYIKKYIDETPVEIASAALSELILSKETKIARDYFTLLRGAYLTEEKGASGYLEQEVLHPDRLKFYNFYMETRNELREIVQRDTELAKYFETLPVLTQDAFVFYRDSGENSRKIGSSVGVNIIFANQLMDAFERGGIYKKWAMYVFTHRLMHELGHKPARSTNENEIEEEAKLIHYDLILYKLYKEQGVQDIIDNVFAEYKDNDLFPSGYYFRFLEALTHLNVTEQRQIIVTYASHQDMTKAEINKLTSSICAGAYEAYIEEINSRPVFVGTCKRFGAFAKLEDAIMENFAPLGLYESELLEIEMLFTKPGKITFDDATQLYKVAEKLILARKQRNNYYDNPPAFANWRSTEKSAELENSYDTAQREYNKLIMQLFKKTIEQQADTAPATMPRSSTENPALAFLKENGFPHIINVDEIKKLSDRVLALKAEGANEFFIDNSGEYKETDFYSKVMDLNKTDAFAAHPMRLTKCALYEKIDNSESWHNIWLGNIIPIMGMHIYDENGRPYTDEDIEKILGLRRIYDTTASPQAGYVYAAVNKGKRTIFFPGPWVVPYITTKEGGEVILKTFDDITELAKKEANSSNISEVIRDLAREGKIKVKLASSLEFVGAGCFNFPSSPDIPAKIKKLNGRNVYIPGLSIQKAAGVELQTGGVGAADSDKVDGIKMENELRKMGAIIAYDSVDTINLSKHFDASQILRFGYSSFILQSLIANQALGVNLRKTSKQMLKEYIGEVFGEGQKTKDLFLERTLRTLAKNIRVCYLKDYVRNAPSNTTHNCGPNFELKDITPFNFEKGELDTYRKQIERSGEWAHTWSFLNAVYSSLMPDKVEVIKRGRRIHRVHFYPKDHPMFKEVFLEELFGKDAKWAKENFDKYYRNAQIKTSMRDVTIDAIFAMLEALKARNIQVEEITDAFDSGSQIKIPYDFDFPKTESEDINSAKYELSIGEAA
ncbi:MAG: hypothetical protein V2A72_07565, partial [Candidatus Omnitrophota bacterium]